MEIHPNTITMKKSIIHNSIFIILFLFAFLERTVFDLGPNYELLTSAIVLSSLFLNPKSSFFLAFLTIAFSDRLIGNSRIFLFTWSGFLIPAIIVSPILKKLITDRKSSIINLLKISVSGLMINVFFFIWTNFGVWMLDSWGMYSKDVSGLITCYINALPFLKNQVVSSLIFIPTGFILINVTFVVYKKLFLEKKYCPDSYNHLHHI